MQTRVPIMERAFQIARSGAVSNIQDIRRTLSHEGYQADALLGRALCRQLLAVIIRAQHQRAEPPVIVVEEHGELPAVAMSEKAAVTEPALTAAQALAARKLLGWGRLALAVKMGISVTPVVQFEKGSIVARAFDPNKAREIFESAGVDFVAENGIAALRLRI